MNSLSSSDHQADEQRNRAQQRFMKLLESLAVKGISQQAAAIRMQVPPQYISDVKSGRRAVTELFARRFGQEFGIDYNWLLGAETGIDVPMDSISAANPDTGKVRLPVLPHPVRGEPHTCATWDGTSVELAGTVAMKVLIADKPYVLRFGAIDRLGIILKNDLVLISQANNPKAKIHVLSQGTKMFLARRNPRRQWEPVFKSRMISDQPISLAGHCLGIVWRSL
jgi:plasmid maintenance system antidote protein VapI